MLVIFAIRDLEKTVTLIQNWFVSFTIMHLTIPLSLQRGRNMAPEHIKVFRILPCILMLTMSVRSKWKPFAYLKVFSHLFRLRRPHGFGFWIY